MVSAADAAALRSVQAGIGDLVRAELEDLFGSLNLSTPESARDVLLQVVPVLVRTYGESAAAIAADWYDDQRAAANVGGRFRAAAQDSPYEDDAVEGTVRRAAGALFTEHPEAALVTLKESAAKFVLGAGRETITRSTDRDPRAAGWQRVTRGGACKFCQMLQGRGGVYKEHTVHFASHKACNCAAAPSWDHSAPEVDVEVYAASARMSGLRRAAANGDRGARRQLEEHSARARSFMESLDD